MRPFPIPFPQEAKRFVATNVGGVSELIDCGETGFLTNPGDIEAMAFHVQSLKNDPVFARQMTRNASAKVSAEFTLKSQTAKLEEVYRQLIEVRSVSQ